MMAVHRVDDANGHVVLTAKDDGTAPFGQCHQQVVAVDQAMGVANQCRYIIQWHAPLFGVLVRNNQESTLLVQVAGIPCDFHDPPDHGWRLA